MLAWALVTIPFNKEDLAERVWIWVLLRDVDLRCLSESFFRVLPLLFPAAFLIFYIITDSLEPSVTFINTI